MPHVTIKCYKGRTEEVKQKCADKIAKDIAELLGCDISHVSISIKDYEKADWKEKVWDVDIEPEMDELYKKPKYKPE